MKTLSLIVFATLTCIAAGAQTDSPVHVNTQDPELGSALQKHAQVQVDQPKYMLGMSAADRDQLFAQSKLMDAVEKKHFDQLDRDLLLSDLQEHSVAELIAKYPEFPRPALEKAKLMLTGKSK